MSVSSHSRVKTESTRPPRTTRSAGSSPRATASRRARSAIPGDDTGPAAGRIPFGEVQVLTPRSLAEALRLKAEHPSSVPIQGGTDVMVELNFDRARPETLLNLNEVRELRGWSRDNGSIRLGAGLTYTEGMEAPLVEALPALAEASRTVGGPQIRNRGTLGGNLGTASPAGDALPPLLLGDAVVELASTGGSRVVPLRDFLVGPKRNALAPDELIVAVRLPVPGPRQP